MFRQEINLYAHFEAANSDSSLLTRNRLLLAWLGFILITLISYAFSQIDIHQLAKKNIKIKTDAAQLQKSFFTLKMKYPALIFSQDAAASIAKMENEIKAQEKILKSVADNESFSNYLTTLASIIVTDVWLSTITIQNSGNDIVLKGETADKIAFQDFLVAIPQHKFFNHFKIESQEIGNIDDKGPIKKFDFQITMLKKKHE